MESLKFIKNRRMIKPELFSPGAITEDEMNMMLEAANWAPTHGLTEPWRFVEVGKEAREEFIDTLTQAYPQLKPGDEKMEKNLGKFSQRVRNTERVIMIYSKRGNKVNIHPVDEWLSVGMAVQNMWILATELGIGLYWGTGMLTHHPGINTHLGLEPEDRFLGYLFMGRYDGEWPEGRRLGSAMEKYERL
jgi:nitroreductase